MNAIKQFVFTAIFIATTITISCSGDDGDNNGTSNGSCNIADYKTIQIGDQIWMAENLNCDVSGSRCYDNKSTNCEKYGKLYDWATAMNLPNSCNYTNCSNQIQTKHRGICPEGWHIPTYAEWNVLVKYVDMNIDSEVGGFNVASTKLKATSGWDSGGNGTDNYGFSALPSGYYSDGGFRKAGKEGEWWIADDNSDSIGESLWMDYEAEHVGWGSDGSKIRLLSVRCVKN